MELAVQCELALLGHDYHTAPTPVVLGALARVRERRALTQIATALSKLGG